MWLKPELFDALISTTKERHHVATFGFTLKEKRATTAGNSFLSFIFTIYILTVAVTSSAMIGRPFSLYHIINIKKKCNSLAMTILSGLLPLENKNKKAVEKEKSPKRVTTVNPHRKCRDFNCIY